jgi:aspartyl aminopeptidase
MASSVPSEIPAIATELVDYLNASWTSFHATSESSRMLAAAGFERLSEKESWDLKPGGKYFFTRNMSSIVAFAVGEKYAPGNGFNIIGAHTDSPCPKLKPVSAIKKGGFLSVGVQTYGGGLWHTWFDRDLSVGGKVLLRRASAKGRLSHELVRVDRPIIRIPTLAIHLDRNVNTEGFKPNTETQFAPVLATAIRGELEQETAVAKDAAADGDDDAKLKKKKKKKKPAHHPLLLAVLAEELNCDPDEIVDFELEVCDTQPSVIGGAAREFIYSGRLDNLASSFCALKAPFSTPDPSRRRPACAWSRSSTTRRWARTAPPARGARWWRTQFAARWPRCAGEATRRASTSAPRGTRSWCRPTWRTRSTRTTPRSTRGTTRRGCTRASS